MRISSVLSHSVQALAEGALIALLVVGLIAGVAVAGRGGKNSSGGGSISLAMVSDANGNGSPNWADTVTFKVSTTATTRPHVRLQCSQSGSVVYTAQAGMYDGYLWPWLQNMTLSSSSWTGGAADCTAQIYWFSGQKTVWGTSLAFGVGA